VMDSSPPWWLNSLPSPGLQGWSSLSSQLSTVPGEQLSL